MDDSEPRAGQFAAPAEHYDRFMGRYAPTLAAALADSAGVAPGMSVLDVGCGAGGLTRELIGRDGATSVAAIDPAPQFAAACGERNPGVDVRVGVAEELPWANARKPKSNKTPNNTASQPQRYAAPPTASQSPAPTAAPTEAGNHPPTPPNSNNANTIAERAAGACANPRTWSCSRSLTRRPTRVRVGTLAWRRHGRDAHRFYPALRDQARGKYLAQADRSARSLARDSQPQENPHPRALPVRSPIRSSKPAARSSPPLGWFDSIAAP